MWYSYPCDIPCSWYPNHVRNTSVFKENSFHRFLTLRNPGNQLNKLKPGNLEMWKPTYVQFSQNPLWGQGTEIRGNLRNLRNLWNLQKISLNVWRNSMIYVQLQTKILKSKLDLQWLKKLLQCVTFLFLHMLNMFSFTYFFSSLFHEHVFYLDYSFPLQHVVYMLSLYMPVTHGFHASNMRLCCI